MNKISNKKKKMLASGTLLSIAIPIGVVVSCGTNAEESKVENTVFSEKSFIPNLEGSNGNAWFDLLKLKNFYHLNFKIAPDNSKLKNGDVVTIYVSSMDIGGTVNEKSIFSFNYTIVSLLDSPSVQGVNDVNDAIKLAKQEFYTLGNIPLNPSHDPSLYSSINDAYVSVLNRYSEFDSLQTVEEVINKKSELITPLQVAVTAYLNSVPPIQSPQVDVALANVIAVAKQTILNLSRIPSSSSHDSNLYPAINAAFVSAVGRYSEFDSLQTVAEVTNKKNELIAPLQAAVAAYLSSSAPTGNTQITVPQVPTNTVPQVPTNTIPSTLIDEVLTHNAVVGKLPFDQKGLEIAWKDKLGLLDSKFSNITLEFDEFTKNPTSSDLTGNAKLLINDLNGTKVGEMSVSFNSLPPMVVGQLPSQEVVKTKIENIISKTTLVENALLPTSIDINDYHFMLGWQKDELRNMVTCTISSISKDHANITHSYQPIVINGFFTRLDLLDIIKAQITKEIDASSNKHIDVGRTLNSTSTIVNAKWFDILGVSHSQLPSKNLFSASVVTMPSDSNGQNGVVKLIFDSSYFVGASASNLEIQIPFHKNNTITFPRYVSSADQQFSVSQSQINAWMQDNGMNAATMTEGQLKTFSSFFSFAVPKYVSSKIYTEKGQIVYTLSGSSIRFWKVKWYTGTTSPLANSSDPNTYPWENGTFQDVIDAIVKRSAPPTHTAQQEWSMPSDLAGKIVDSTLGDFPEHVYSPFWDISRDVATSELAKNKYYTMAFIQSNSVDEVIPHFGIADIDNDAEVGKINQIRKAGAEPIFSFGGSAGVTLSHAALSNNWSVEKLAALYASLVDTFQMKWVDFDCEGSDTLEIDTFRALAVKKLKEDAKYSNLIVSITVPAMETGLTDANPHSRPNVLAWIKNKAPFDIVNMMAMDYGSGTGNTDFDRNSFTETQNHGHADAAIQAATALHDELKGHFDFKDDADVWKMVGVTPMIGVNDDHSTFTLHDVDVFAEWATKTHKIGYIGMWSLTRDHGKTTKEPLLTTSTGGPTGNPDSTDINSGEYGFQHRWIEKLSTLSDYNDQASADKIIDERPYDYYKDGDAGGHTAAEIFAQARWKQEQKVLQDKFINLVLYYLKTQNMLSGSSATVTDSLVNMINSFLGINVTFKNINPRPDRLVKGDWYHDGGDSLWEIVYDGELTYGKSLIPVTMTQLINSLFAKGFRAPIDYRLHNLINDAKASDASQLSVIRPTALDAGSNLLFKSEEHLPDTIASKLTPSSFPLLVSHPNLLSDPKLLKFLSDWNKEVGSIDLTNPLDEILMSKINSVLSKNGISSSLRKVPTSGKVNGIFGFLDGALVKGIDEKWAEAGKSAWEPLKTIDWFNSLFQQMFPTTITKNDLLGNVGTGGTIDATGVPWFDEGATYATGDRVIYDGKLYESRLAYLGSDPSYSIAAGWAPSGVYQAWSEVHGVVENIAPKPSADEPITLDSSLVYK